MLSFSKFVKKYFVTFLSTPTPLATLELSEQAAKALANPFSYGQLCHLVVYRFEGVCHCGTCPPDEKQHFYRGKLLPTLIEAETCRSRISRSPGFEARILSDTLACEQLLQLCRTRTTEAMKERAALLAKYFAQAKSPALN